MKILKREKTTDFTQCPKCGNFENFHYNYDFMKKEAPIIDILCNECGEFFKPNKLESNVQIQEES